VAQAYGRLPPAALMLLAVIAVELSWALATFMLADVGESGTAWLSTTFAAVVFTAVSRPQVDGRLRKYWLLILLFGLTDAGMTLPFLLSLQHGIPLGIASAIAFLGTAGACRRDVAAFDPFPVGRHRRPGRGVADAGDRR
jgi:threonine/homoserine efflux transporter RhtA